jgi:hypothetical protein
MDKINISKDALINASNLRNNNLQRRNITEVITEIVRRVNDELIVAHREGKHHLLTTVPITFAISNMSNKDSQRVIYARVISELKNKDYRVWISPQKNVCQLKITWMSPEDENEMKLQTQIIVKHTKKILL